MTARKTEEVWAERVRAWRASGETAGEFATGKGYASSTLHGWASRLGREGRPQFVRLVPKSAATVDTAMVVEVGAARIRVTQGFDAKLLADLVAALGGAS